MLINFVHNPPTSAKLSADSEEPPSKFKRFPLIRIDIQNAVPDLDLDLGVQFWDTLTSGGTAGDIINKYFGRAFNLHWIRIRIDFERIIRILELHAELQIWAVENKKVFWRSVSAGYAYLQIRILKKEHLFKLNAECGINSKKKVPSKGRTKKVFDPN